MQNIRKCLQYRYHILCALMPLVIGIFTPSAIAFIVKIKVLGMNINQAFTEVFESQFAEGQNYFLLAVIGLIPFFALTLFLFFQAITQKLRVCLFLCMCGFIGIFVLMIPAYYSYWKALYTGKETSSTGSLIFLFIPIFCLVSLTISLFIGKFITRQIWNTKDETRTPKSRLAIISLILSLLGLLNLIYFEYILCILGLTLAIIALIKIKQSSGLLSGRVVAISAIFICILNIFYNIGIWWYILNKTSILP